MMMEVEEIHGFRDADMIPEEAEMGWDDQMMQDDHHQPIPEVEMANEFLDDAIEYDMEDTSGHLEPSDDPIISPAKVVELTEETILTTSVLPQSSTPPPGESAATDNTDESKPTEPPVGPSTEVPAAESETHPANAEQPNDLPQPESDPADATRESESAASNKSPSPPKVTLAEGPPSPTVSQADAHADNEPDRSEPYEAVVNPHTTQEDADGAVDLQPEPNEESAGPVDESATELYPSPVLVLSPSSAFPSFYLFAPPEDASSEEVVYLADQPQLFYEPLHVVFDALRALADDLGIMRHAELALCSEALDLNVSEDNVFSREVSLNDLNTLHVGCELEGPMALRLDQNSPRFITRYRAIMAELQRVSSTQDVERSADTGELLVPHDDERREADQTEQDQERNDDIKQDPAAATEPQGGATRSETDQASADPDQQDRQDQTTIPETEKASPHPESNLAGDAAREKDSLPESSSRPASRKSSLNTVGDPSLTQPQHDTSPAENSEKAGEADQVTTRDDPKTSTIANTREPTEGPADLTKVNHHAKGLPANNKQAGDIDNSSVAASEGIHPYRVTFNVSDQEEEEAGDMSSVLGDETQTTRFESQMTGPSFMFSTQDGVDVPYHPDMYLYDNDDDADAYAADLERGYATADYPRASYDSSRRINGNDLRNEEYVDDENTKSSPNMLKSPTSELWDDGPDELLFYEAEEGDANEVERARSEEGENSQEPREHPEEYDEHTEHDEFAISYEDDVIDPVPETIPVLTSRTELPPVETKPSSPIRSWSTHSSKRSFNDDGSENGADYLGRKAEAKRAKIQ